MFLESAKKRIEREFGRFAEQFPELGAQAENEAGKYTETEGLLLKYLYACMPLSDAVNYPPSVFAQFARHGTVLLKERVWKEEGEEAEGLFLDCVVFHRVNTEGITPCRELFYRQLKDRVAGKSLQEAILEVNYWCAEEVTYHCSDDRTLSAEAVYRSGTGRCGEESVFTVNALRSIGIPARQVYSHRWAHCDDNHAWVEVWCGGGWHYMGACEPEETLDKGWFTGAASRAMMINSRSYGFQKQEGRVVEKWDMTMASSQLERYAHTKSFCVCVKDGRGDPVQGALVCCELLNYSELVPVISGYTDVDGTFRAESGKGSLLIYAEKAGLRGSVVVNLCSGDEAAVTIKEKDPFFNGEEWTRFDMVAPKEGSLINGETEIEKRSEGEEKKKEAVRKYKQKMERLPGYQKVGGIPVGKGNEREIRRFLEETKGEVEWKKKMLEDLVPKDLKDCRADVLAEHFSAAMKYRRNAVEEIFRRGILQPRIGNEQPGAYRKQILEFFSEEQKETFRQEPEQIRTWIREKIREIPQWEYRELLTFPGSALKYGYASQQSQEILFTAISRSLGIPAELDPIDGKARCIGEKEKQYAKITFTGKGSGWSYGQNWTIARREEKELGGWKTLRFDGNIGGDLDLSLQRGEYRVVTTNRLPRGDQFAAAMYFTVDGKTERTIELFMREAGTEDLLMDTALPEFALTDKAGGQNIFLRTPKQAEAEIFIWLEMGKEPTEHILNEMCEKKNEFSELGDKVHFVLREEKELEDPTFLLIEKAFPDAGVYFDFAYEAQEKLARRMYREPSALPFLLVTDRVGKGVYAESGYNVGTGEMLLRIKRAADREKNISEG